MSKLENLKNIHKSRVTIRIATTEIPLHLCLETLNDISDIGCYQENAAIEVNGVVFVKDAP